MTRIKKIWKTSNDQDGFELKLTDGSELTISRTCWNDIDRKEICEGGMIFHANNMDIFFSKSEVESADNGFDLDNAEKDFEECKILYNKGVALFDLKKYEEAIIVFDQILCKNPRDIDALNLKGFALFLLEKYKEAVETLVLVLEVDFKNSEAINKIQKSLGAMEEYEIKLELCDKLLKTGCEYVLFYKFSALSQLKRHEEIVRLCDEFLENNYYFDNKRDCSDNVLFYLHRKSNALFDLEKYEEAIRVFDVLLNIYNYNGPSADPYADGEEENIYCNLLNYKGRALLELKRYKEAIDVFDKILKIYPEYSSVSLNKISEGNLK
jgi:tetratricopeptide (TPR) repeat protein